MGNIQLGKARLSEAEQMAKGWNGMQGKVAMTYILLGENSKAVAVIRSAIKENPKWKQYLSAFYLLKDQPGMEGLINENHLLKRIGSPPFLSSVNWVKMHGPRLFAAKSCIDSRDLPIYIICLANHCLMSECRLKRKKNCKKLSGLILPTRKRPLFLNKDRTIRK